MISAASQSDIAVDAARFASAAGVEVRILSSMADLVEAVQALRGIWGGDDLPIDPGLLRAVSFSGGYVSAALADDRIVGAAAGFLGQHPDDREPHLHSHIAGVVSTWQGRHVGLALKQHQRAWALAAGIGVIEWTFDPLIRRNAYFNLIKLGADIVGFEANFYGSMRDAINAGDQTDRAVVRWDLLSDTAIGAAAGRNRHEPDGGAVMLRPDADGRPAIAAQRGDVLRAWIPEDAVALRHRDPAAGQAWRSALRDTFGAAIADGYRATSISRDGWYTLVRA